MLPSYATSLLGRDDLIAVVDRAIAEGARVVTLVGPAGVGKTRLSVAVAARHGDRVFCDLRAARRRDDLIDALLRALRPAVDLARMRGDVAKRVGGWLRARGPVCVVLDNFEQLDDASAEVVGVWRDEAPDATLLVTSRHPLRLSGQRLVQVTPLSARDDGPATSLFFDRAELARGARLARDAHTLAVVGELVRALDGLPLAIELAAARLEVMSLDELRERLEARFAVLRLPDARGGVEHHDALWDALSWSWQLLSEPERDALRCASVFADGFTLEAAEATMCSRAMTALDALHALRQKSLLRVSAGASSRYALYESVRAFARCKLDESPDGDAVRARVDAWLVSRGAAWAEATRSRGARRALDRLEAERGNLLEVLRLAVSGPATPERARTALGAALALAPLVATSALASVNLDALDAALDAAKALGDDPSRAAALSARGLARRYQGRVDEARDDLERARDMARACGDARGEAEAIGRLGSVVALTGDLDGGEALHRDALARFEALGDLRGRGEMRSLLGVTRMHRDGARREAFEDFTAAAIHLREAGDPLAENVNLLRVVAVELELGELDACDEAVTQLLVNCEAVGDAYTARMARGYRAVVRHLLGHLDDAQERYEQAVEEGRSVAVPQFESTYAAYLALLHLERGDHAAARRSAEHAWTVIAPVEDPRVESFARAALAMADAALLRVELAREGLEATRALLATQTLADFPRIAEAVGATVALVEAQLAADRGDRAPLLRAVDDAEALSATLSALPSDEVRLAARALSHLSSELRGRADAWTVDRRGRWFEGPDARRVSLTNRATMVPMLAALVERRFAAPGEALTLASLAEAAWPGESLAPKVLSNRVHVALSTLRKMGLDAALRREGDGYCLAPDVSMVVVDE